MSNLSTYHRTSLLTLLTASILLATKQIKGKKIIKMNYDNYEMKIVEIFSVAIQGWPCGKIANPGTIGRENVFKLLDSLEGQEGKQPTCYWVQLTEDELSARKKLNQQRAEEVYKPRKKATHKKGAAKSAETVDSTDDEQGEGEPMDEDEDEEEEEEDKSSSDNE